ncbi:hypothetical protein GGH99_006032, partial [Coemansia sp. RSA 1285]
MQRRCRQQQRRWLANTRRSGDSFAGCSILIRPLVLTLARLSATLGLCRFCHRRH